MQTVGQIPEQRSERIWNSTESRALALLKTGCGPESVAFALGLEVSRISQMLSMEDFALEVAKGRYERLQKHNIQDDKLDTLEAELIEQFQGLKALLIRPLEILKAAQIVNTMKRRGAANPEVLPNAAEVVSINMPQVIKQKFVTNVNMQVISTGAQDLVTIQPANLLKKLNLEKIGGQDARTIIREGVKVKTPGSG